MDAIGTSTIAAAAMASLCLVLCITPLATTAFVPTSSSDAIRAATSLHAVPPMIIGPMIKKMREEQAKKKMPLVNEDEARGEARGLRVGGNSWKWPPIWPYDPDFFTPNEDIATPDPASQANPMMGLLSGMAQTSDVVEKADAVNKLDPLQYWGEEKAAVKTDLDLEAVAKLKE